jgi:biopolymer transport protein ExbD
MSQTKRMLGKPLKIDMTPMVDCATLLLIFFVLVIDVSQKEFEDLMLPAAKYAQPDEKPPDNRAIVNVTQDGRVVFKRNAYYDPKTDKDNYSRIAELMRFFKTHYAKKDSIHQQQVGGGQTMTVIDDPILIRADKWTEWHYVGKFMEKCVVPDAAYWKLELALSEKDKEDQLFKGRK